MSNKTVSGLTHLLQGMAIAMSDGKAEADVRYVPVSHTPYVRVVLGQAWDGLEDLRGRICMELAGRGYRPVGGDKLVKASEGAFTYIDVGSPAYDAVGKVAYLDMSVSGPYSTEQSLNRSPRDSGMERRTFEAAVSRSEDEAFLRNQGAESVINALLTNAPFKLPYADIHRLHAWEDRSIVRRIAVAFAGQRLETVDDLVEAADLYDVLGLDRVTAPAP